MITVDRFIKIMNDYIYDVKMSDTKDESMITILAEMAGKIARLEDSVARLEKSK